MTALDVAAAAGRALRWRRLAGTGLVATVAAVVTTTLAAALARAAGVGLEVPDAGEAIPLAGVAFVTGVCSVAGLVIAMALLRWSTHPDVVFVRIAVSLTVVSLVPPLLSGAEAATVATLVGLHLIAAALVIPPVSRALGRTPGS